MPGSDLHPVVLDPAEAKDSVSIWFVRQAVAGLVRHGRSPDPLLRKAGIPSSLLEIDQARISAGSFGALWLGIAAELDDELFGLDTRRMKVGSFAVLCRATALAPSLRPALLLALQFFNLAMDDAKVGLSEVEAGTIQVTIEDLPGRDRPQDARVFAHETVLIMLHGLMCWLIGRRIPIHAAAFAYGRPPWWVEYQSMYSAELEFDAERSSLSLDARVLDAAIHQDEASVREFLREAPHNFIVKFKDRNSWSARIRRRLRNAVPADWPDFGAIAAEFEIASSTLHRKLDFEGISFREIKDALRRDLAIDRLTHSGTSIAQIAEELGFAEPSAFHRAFKQWTGVPPGDYRRRQLAAG